MAPSTASIRNSISSWFSHPTMRPRVLSDLDSADPSHHTIYAYLSGSLLALVEIKYQGMNNSPFNDHPAVMILLLVAIIVHVLALLVWNLRSSHQINLRLLGWMCHSSGSLACELLLLLLVSPIWSFLIHLSSLLLLLPFLLFYNYPIFSDAQSAERQAAEPEDIEAGTSADERRAAEPGIEAGASAEGQAAESDIESGTIAEGRAAQPGIEAGTSAEGQAAEPDPEPEVGTTPAVP